MNPHLPKEVHHARLWSLDLVDQFAPNIIERATSISRTISTGPGAQDRYTIAERLHRLCSEHTGMRTTRSEMRCPCSIFSRVCLYVVVVGLNLRRTFACM